MSDFGFDSQGSPDSLLIRNTGNLFSIKILMVNVVSMICQDNSTCICNSYGKTSF